MKVYRRATVAAAAITALAAVLLFVFAPPIAQDERYHVFSDGRTLIGIPNFWNVVSNLPFACVGILGLLRLRGFTARLLFSGVLLTCFCSAYYHLAPNDSRLVWDRLPMTLVFTSFLFWVITEKEECPDLRMLLLLLFCGISSVVWWRMTGDLRPYVLVQFGPMGLMLAALWDVRRRKYLGAVLGFYFLAKVAEHFDHAIYSSLPISGHTLKHLLAACGSYCILRWRTGSHPGDVIEPAEPPAAGIDAWMPAPKVFG
jgi:hypothetical protein